MQQGINVVLLKVITLYRLNIYCIWAFKINTASSDGLSIASSEAIQRT